MLTLNESQAEPERLGLKERGEYELFTVVRKFAAVKDEPLAIRSNESDDEPIEAWATSPPGWWDTRGGKNKVSQTLQVESWEPDFEPLNLCPVEEAEPPFLAAAVDELGRAFATE